MELYACLNTNYGMLINITGTEHAFEMTLQAGSIEQVGHVRALLSSSRFDKAQIKEDRGNLPPKSDKKQVATRVAHCFASAFFHHHPAVLLTKACCVCPHAC